MFFFSYQRFGPLPRLSRPRGWRMPSFICHVFEIPHIRRKGIDFIKRFEHHYVTTKVQKIFKYNNTSNKISCNFNIRKEFRITPKTSWNLFYESSTKFLDKKRPTTICPTANCSNFASNVSAIVLHMLQPNFKSFAPD